ncbi:MAG: glutamate--tRNA ligase family protein [Solirubrobacterales bacterium]
MVRARFAPSPTGALHLGSARTALLNWVFVRSRGGRLLLRFDDTDSSRSERELEPAIESELRWLGLDWDDGPVHQSDRIARYEEVLTELPVHRRDGAYEFEGRVIARADGSPLYHLATAVDDVDDAITHVLRGRDHLSNTELQVAIIRAMGAEPPEYVHAPLLIFAEGAKVSKREGEGLTLGALRAAGYPAGAVVNALALSLADFGEDELMSGPADVAARFDLSRLHSADSQFDEQKLRWVSGEHIRSTGTEELAGRLAEFGGGSLPEAAVEAARTDGETFRECAAVGRALVDPPEPDIDAQLAIDAPEGRAAFMALDALAPSWPLSIDDARREFDALKAGLRADGLSLASALHGLRAALTGRVQGPEFPYVLACVTPERWELARRRLRAGGE